MRENQVTSLFEDHTGRLWVGIDNTLTIYSNGKFRRIDKPDGRPVGVIVGITEDVDYNIWAETIGPPRNLIRIQDLKVRQEFPAPQMPAAREVAAHPGGGIWLGLINGDLAHYRDGTTEVIRFNHGQDSDVRQLTVNSDGSVLGATAFGLSDGSKERSRLSPSGTAFLAIASLASSQTTLALCGCTRSVGSLRSRTPSCKSGGSSLTSGCN